ncbi:MAG TPA: glycosyltransferase family 9 protein [Ktedonobacteraceae bacterium]
MLTSPWLNAKNILVVRLDNLGDVLMLGPALRAIKEHSPQTRLTLLASPAGSAGASLLPWIDATLVWRAVWQDAAQGARRMSFEPEREQELIRHLATLHFDAALIFTSFSQTPHAPGYACYLAGIPLRAGESTEFGGSILSDELKGTPIEMHQVERNLRLVEHLGFAVRDRQLAFTLSDNQRQTALQHLVRVGIDPRQPFVLLHPGASAQARRYPAERFGAVVRLLQQRGWPVLVTGTAREQELLAQVQRVAPTCPFLIGETTLTEYAALIERAALVICNNTLPLHLADAFQTPVLALYSGTDYEEQWQPRATQARLLRRPTPCHPCFFFECPLGLPCLDIAPEEVVDVALAMLAETTSAQESSNAYIHLPGGRL